MNWVDFIILLVVVLFALEGTKQGFFNQAINVAGFLLALIAALIFYSQVAILLTKFFHMPPIAANPIGFLIVWVIVESVFFGAVNTFLQRIRALYSEISINKYLGFIPAVASALLFISFVLLFIVSLPINPIIKKDFFDSKIGLALMGQVALIERPLNKVFGPITKQGLTFLTVKPEEKGTLDLQFTQDKLTNDYQSEKQMIELVNNERAKQGIGPLSFNEPLATVARSHSQDMFRRGYFSHYSPEDKDVGDRLLDADINYNVAGENLALAPTLIRAHDGLINSPGHRRNILDPAFHRIGIGVIDGGVYGKMFTQVFTD